MYGFQTKRTINGGWKFKNGHTEATNWYNRDMQPTRHDRAMTLDKESWITGPDHLAAQDHEINLREHIEVIIKKKWLVFGFFSTATLLTAAWNFRAPTIFEISMVIAPPNMPAADGGTMDLDTVGNIKAKIESGAFNTRIINELNLEDKSLHFNVSQPKDSKLIRINLRQPTEKTDSAKKILTKLLMVLDLGYAQIIEDKKNGIDNQIKLVLNQINIKENEIKLQNEQFRILADRERQYFDEIRESRINSQKLAANREALFQRRESKDDVSALLYTVTMQQNLSYFTQLQSELADVKTRKERLLAKVDDLKNAIQENKIYIENLNLSKNGMHNIQVIQDPLISLQPIGPQRMENIFLASIIGLILGLISVFFIEYWENCPTAR